MCTCMSVHIYVSYIYMYACVRIPVYVSYTHMYIIYINVHTRFKGCNAAYKLHVGCVWGYRRVQVSLSGLVWRFLKSSTFQEDCGGNLFNKAFWAS